MKLSRLNRLYHYGWSFGIAQTGVLLSARVHWRKAFFWFHKWKKVAVLNYIRKYYSNVIDYYTDFSKKDFLPIGDKYIVWFFWDSERMPPIVEKCYHALLSIYSDRVCRLSIQNIHNYIDIPEHIEIKKKNGLISIQHYSDYLRFALLYKYGGLWVDATVLISSSLCFPSMTNFISVRNHDLRYVPNNGAWQIYFIGGGRENVLFGFIRDLLAAYWKRENDIIDYFFTDYAINIAYFSYPNVRKMIDSLPPLTTGYDVHSLLFNFNKPFDYAIYNEIIKEVNVHKLTYRGTLNELVGNKLSFYGWLLKHL